MLRSDPELRQAWTRFVADYPACFAVTLAYNPSVAGTAYRCWRILPEDGECLPLPTPGMPLRPGEYRLPSTRKIALEQVHRDLDRLHRNLDRRLFGARFHKLPPERRSGFLGFIENAQENVHAHLGWRVPEPRRDEFLACLPFWWRRLVPSGSAHVVPRSDPEGWAAYMLKEQLGADSDEPALFVSSWTARRPHS